MAKSVSSKRVGNTEPTAISETIEPLDVPTFYTNHTELETTLWDVCFKIGETISIDSERNIRTAKLTARIRMSPQHAKVVLGILQTHVEHYERQFGPIPRPATPTGKDKPASRNA